MRYDKTNLVLVDTSIWIDCFKRPESKYADIVSELISQDRACIAGVVLTEIIQGVKTKSEKRALTETLSVLPYIEVGRKDWVATGWILNDLRSKGITVPITDAILAQICSRNNMAILTLDKHFKHFRKLKHFKIGK